MTYDVFTEKQWEALLQLFEETYAGNQEPELNEFLSRENIPRMTLEFKLTVHVETTAKVVE